MNFLFVGGPEHGKFHSVFKECDTYLIPQLAPVRLADFLGDSMPYPSPVMAAITYRRFKVALGFPVVRSVYVCERVTKDYDWFIADALGKALDRAMVTEDTEPWELVEHL